MSTLFLILKGSITAGIGGKHNSIDSTKKGKSPFKKGVPNGNNAYNVTLSSGAVNNNNRNNNNAALCVGFRAFEIRIRILWTK